MGIRVEDGESVEYRKDFNRKIEYVRIIYNGKRYRPETAIQKVMYKSRRAFYRIVPQNIYTQRTWKIKGHNVSESIKIKKKYYFDKEHYRGEITHRKLYDVKNRTLLELTSKLNELMFKDMILNRNRLKFIIFKKQRVKNVITLSNKIINDRIVFDFKPKFKLLTPIYMHVNPRLIRELKDRAVHKHKMSYENTELQKRISSYRRHYGLDRR